MFEQPRSWHFLLEVGQLFHTPGNLLPFCRLLASLLGHSPHLLIALSGQFFVELCNIYVLSFHPLHRLLVFVLVVLYLLQQCLLPSHWYFVLILFQLNDASLRSHQFLMLVHLLSLVYLSFLSQLFHLLLELPYHLLVLSRITHLLGVLQQLLYMPVLIVYHLLLSLHLQLKRFYLTVLLLDNALQIHDSLHCDLIGLFALIVLDRLLQSFYHFIGILQLQWLRLQAHRSSILLVIKFEFVLSGLLQLLIQSN